MTADEVRELMAHAMALAGSQRAWARKIGVSAPFVNRIFRGDKEPSGAVLNALGLEREEASYRRKK